MFTIGGRHAGRRIALVVHGQGKLQHVPNPFGLAIQDSLNSTRIVFVESILLVHPLGEMVK